MIKFSAITSETAWAPESTSARRVVDELTLLPCPFCGGLAASAGILSRYWIACTDCNCRTPAAKRMTDAIELWNQRMRSPAQRLAKNDRDAL